MLEGSCLLLCLMFVTELQVVAGDGAAMWWQRRW
jgi:hypothetical protein